jgi:hypothetical protein
LILEVKANQANDPEAINKKRQREQKKEKKEMEKQKMSKK